MKLPSRVEAERLLVEAAARNPGPWEAHSRNVALAAKSLAEKLEHLDSETAYIFGLLHDIGRQEGVTGMRHTLDGYRFLQGLAYDDVARICLTHSFPLQNVDAIFGHWDVSQEDYDWLRSYLHGLEYNDYDRLLQLCDCLALPEGIVLLEKRMVDVALRHGVNDHTVPKWQAYCDLRAYFEAQLAVPMYAVLPRVVETTFGLADELSP